MLPVHYACQNKGPAAPNFMDALLTAFPQAVDHGKLKVDNVTSTIDFSKSSMLNQVIEGARIQQTLQSLE